MTQGKRNDPTVEPSEADYWYAAGFVDGEGCITVRESGVTIGHQAKLRGWNPSWYASVTVSQVDPRPLQWMQARWGGALRAMRTRRERERPAWEWCIVGQQAYRFLGGVLPMLKCKDEQARNALKLRDLRSGRGVGLTPDQIIERQAIRDEALRLNRLGQFWRELPEVTV